MPFVKTIFSLIFILILAGCSTLKPVGPISAQTQKVQGIFAVITPQTAQTGHFIWLQTGQDFALELYGPLGLGATTLSRTGNTVRLQTAKGQTYQAASSEAVLQQVLGWSMPVSGLTEWLWGKPAPTTPFSATYNANQQILTLQQEGWSIVYVWPATGNLPARITLNRDSIKVKIAISSS